MLHFIGKLRAASIVFAVMFCLGTSYVASFAQQAPAKPAQANAAPGPTGASEMTPAQIDEIVKKFAAKEKEFKKARDNYTYRQIFKVQELSDEGEVRGTYEVHSDIIFDKNGKRDEKVVFAPISTLKRLGLGPEDEHDLVNIQPFVLTTDDLPKYNVNYLGKQKVDEVPTYVFSIGPKVIEKGQRYFEGQIYVDDRDFQIVKSYGKAVPEVRKKGQENLVPRFETYREQVDGKYWFPTWTGADDTLHFSTGDVRMRLLVRYENYREYKFKSDTSVTYGDIVPQQGEQQKEKK